MDNSEQQLESFIAKFDDAKQNLIRGLRAALQRRLRDCAELVWDNYNFLVIGYSPTERPSDYIVSLAAAANGVSLSFNRGAELADPEGVLEGSAKVNRFVRLPLPSTLHEPAIAEMIDRACNLNATSRPWIAGGKLIIRSVSAKQRPRRRD
jgi:hypothetical protein